MAAMRREAEVIVVGSGGAGLTAALSAAVAGARVVVLEASSRWGGTTAVSGGQVWVPNNHRMAAARMPDSAEEALAYCLGQAPGREIALVETFVHAAPAMAIFVEANSPIRWQAMHFPDSFAERPGGKSGARHLEVEPLELGEFGAVDELFWPAAYPAVLTNNEVWGLGLAAGAALPMEAIELRMAAGQATLGLGLVAGLLRGCRAAGVELVRECRVVSLEQDEHGALRGVGAELAGEPVRFRASRAVVLANGGYEHDHGLTARLLGLPRPLPLSPPVNHGDALRLAARAGAQISHAGESWSWPAVDAAERTWGDPAGTPWPELVVAERCFPHVIWVNWAGRRFVDESCHNSALALSEVDPGTHLLRNMPAWAVGDAQFRRRYTTAGVAPGQPAGDRLAEAATLAALAGQIGVEAAALERTVARFNEFAVSGRDEDFHRGQTPYDRYCGDPHAPHPSLGTLDQPPFFAVPLHRGVISTKGGPRTDTLARVLAWDGDPIPGLYAAGSAAAAVFGPGAIAGGMHLGTAMTWGWVAGSEAAIHS